MKALDGPAAGVNLSLRTCPKMLRLVHGPDGWDALDQRGDEPREGERIFVYRLVDESHGVVFVRPGGRYEYGDYRFVRAAEDGELRDRESWKAYALDYLGVTPEEAGDRA